MLAGFLIGSFAHFHAPKANRPRGPLPTRLCARNVAQALAPPRRTPDPQDVPPSKRPRCASEE
eukprot:12661409-Alexandrium_andersonii.AAC.1